MKIVLASNNSGKLNELQALFAPLQVQLIAQGELGVTEAEEPYHTFIENALTKARNASAQSGLPAIADDAGLCVDCFGGKPGVQTAFYATQFGYDKSDANNVKALLENMQGITERGAALVSTLVGVRNPDDPEPLVAVGRAAGQITQAPIGEHGFGFDPVLYIPQLQRTFAQLSPAEKNQHSHRGQAAAAMLGLLRQTWLASVNTNHIFQSL